MHLCFIDESGTPPKKAKADKIRTFVIAGVIMHEAQWHGVSRELKSLKARPEYKIQGEVKWRYFGAGNTDADNSVAHLSQEMKDKFRVDLFSIITKRKSIKIIACASSIKAAYALSYVKNEEDLYAYTYKTVSERFQYYLQDVSKTVGDQQNGIIIADHRGKKQDEAMRKYHHGLIDEDSMFVSNYQNCIETVFLTPSHLSVGIQLADMVAGAINRAFNSEDPRFADLLTSSFRSSTSGKIEGYGLVKFPKNGWE